MCIEERCYSVTWFYDYRDEDSVIQTDASELDIQSHTDYELLPFRCDRCDAELPLLDFDEVVTVILHNNGRVRK